LLRNHTNTTRVTGYQNYDWGKIGSQSAVAQFAQHSNPNKVEIDQSKPYAELWMGTHPKLPSVTIPEEESLRDVIAKDPKALLGDEIITKFGQTNELPFLFKVLSIGKVLSIQAHPDKELAKVLHFQDPKNYPDDNHKPEMAIAVTSFEGFCGFKPLNQIRDHLQNIPEFRELVGEETSNAFISGINTQGEVAEGSTEDKSNRLLLKSVFDKVMNASDDVIVKQSEKLLESAKSKPEIFTLPDLPELILTLNEQFPNDVGLFCGCLLLNHCKLQAGEAMFLKAKDPHAYISGDIIECMAASDNVVRAGFTSKFKDVKNLVEMLDYSYDDVSKQKMEKIVFKGAEGAGESILFDPPIQEFAVVQTTFQNGAGVRKFKALDGPSIVIITNGKGVLKGDGVELDAEIGYNYFVAAGVEVELVAQDKDFTSYRAFVEA
jgi:mannose-6-phosphate isomerase